MKKWEYWTIFIKGDPDQELNRLGDEGWEAIGFSYEKGMHSGWNVMMKREKVQKDAEEQVIDAHQEAGEKYKK